MATNTLIEQQHQIFQLLDKVTNGHKEEVERAETRRESETQLAVARRDEAQSQANAELEEIHQLLTTARETAKGWEKRISGHTPPASINTTDRDVKQEIGRCLSAAKQVLEEIKTFVKFNSESGNLTCLGAIIGVILGLVSCGITAGIWNASVGYATGNSIPIDLLIGLIVALLIVAIGGSRDEKRASNIKKLFATLETTVADADGLIKIQLKTLEAAYQHQLAEIQERYKSDINQADERYSLRTVEELQPAFMAFNQSVGQTGFLSVPWDGASWEKWQPVTSRTPITRLGTLQPSETLPTVSALIACPGNANIFLKATGSAKNTATAAIQSVMLRLLSTQPPGKVRFTLIDPIGLGQNVATFMQLADHHEDLVGSKAWSESRHIDQQLADLSEHMENIIQKYLRGQFKSIEEYNQQAGEVAEPYRLLVVIGFPVKFSQEAAGRLLEIATNGPRCGVSTIIMLDTEQPLPYGFNLDDLERVATVIAWDGQRFVWKDKDFENCQLTLDAPPPLELFNRLLQVVGSAAKATSEVKVPFARIAPSQQEWWRGSTREGLKVPLGRAGATKLQYLDLGKGMAQHALVAGKTGSGKTTLLHILITNLCLTYSPDELELYLVDFKTVGFTAYATYKLPHARVVAIQSEREFGLSVLQGLDSELERRKQIFSKAGVQDLAQYRGVQPNLRMPRILLLVDEFQEFFTQDDKVAQDASLCLDRLIRQGRAFGIHVMLGSQTLAGSYSLARATIGQMAVRIALQCEEADSRLVLSDDNPAARLLSRPGEAIYNSANGLVEGNNPFQCSWLPDEELDTYLAYIQRFAQHHRYAPAWKQIIFDGSKDAEVVENRFLQDVLQSPTWTTPQKVVQAWLGDPIAIKEPTAVQMRFQAGNNLLIVGQQEEAAFGMLLTALVSLTAQHAPGTARFYVADFSPVDAAYAGAIERSVQALPHQVKVVNRRGLLSTLTHIADEVQDRMEADAEKRIPIYLFFYGLQRARDLRPDEDFSFSSFGSEDSKTVSPAKQFTTILREGPELGIHTLAWCDTLANLNRTLERGALREFEVRVVFQMSQEDSLNLVDSPTASKLGPHRALLYSEETGRTEKFRPYGLPTDEWLQQAVSYIHQKR